MNVLVYSGPGVSTASLTHTLFSLRTALSSAYAVQPILPQALINEPWQPTCALLVIPGGRDLPYVSSLSSALPKIRKYVEEGGKFLGACAGAYFASEECDFERGTELEVWGKRELRFFPGRCEGCTFPGFKYESEDGAQAVDIFLDLPAWGTHAPSSGELKGVYYNGGGHFHPPPAVLQSGEVTVLARYANPPTPEKGICMILCRVGQGLALLTSPHVEYPLLAEPAKSALDKSGYHSSGRDGMEQARKSLVLSLFRLLGLDPPVQTEAPTTPLPQFLVSSPSRPELSRRVLEVLKSIASPSESQVPEIKDANDTFLLYPRAAAETLLSQARARLPDNALDSTPGPRAIIAYTEGLPGKAECPLFDLQGYSSELERVREDLGLAENEGDTKGEEWGMGQVMFYGEAVTSTQTLLDRNPILLTALPSPFLSLATYQLTARGRGSNIWLSPSGCLQFSLRLRPPPSFPSSRLVFVQYVFSVAVVRACRALLRELGGEAAAERVRLKWPNDVYAIVERGERRKLGGILVGTNYLKGRFELVIGCGLNVLNTRPTTSLKHLLSLHSAPPPTLESVLARLLPTFDAIWSLFLSQHGDFRLFEEEYLTYWLHSDQLVRLTTVSPPVDVRIVGITRDYGLLRTLRVKDPWRARLGEDEYIDLQPDGNSFDMTEGLIKKKT
ncbi:class II aaRS and biotin synthetase [Dacryopinax primogenitus]|uniref:Class II aaRS and biotin synthetase n=1 Tax=Dacryopinax primogenitus (strain DJM 731) TaxID=1858805 RepID=M5FXW5_DACPD|nr:class II aaRS and biotin synthetase [Dacryopinax primogenitus]EJU01359.1 class II aaRS and biotin synthetase [Dacryopinax primogenitus]